MPQTNKPIKSMVINFYIIIVQLPPLLKLNGNFKANVASKCCGTRESFVSDSKFPLMTVLLP